MTLFSIKYNYYIMDKELYDDSNKINILLNRTNKINRNVNFLYYLVITLLFFLIFMISDIMKKVNCINNKV